MFQALTIIIFRPTVVATGICIKEYANAYCFHGQQNCRKVFQGFTIFFHIFLKIWVSCSDNSMKELSSLCLSIPIWLWMLSMIWVYCYAPSQTTAVVVLIAVFLVLLWWDWDSSFWENHNNRQFESSNKEFGHDGFIKTIKWLGFQY